MECLQIDWKNIDEKFERDEFYESIQAPKWIDFTAPLQPVDDHEWFCGRPGCMHVKKTLDQPEDSILSDSEKSTFLQIAKKVVPAAKSTVSAAGGKRARAAISSSYSSVSDIKEAFAKHKVLHLAKMPCFIESHGQAIKKTAHASENQNPNQACKAQVGVSKLPMLKASEGLAKKMRTTDSKYVAGKPPPQEVSESTSSTFFKQVNQSHQTRALLDVSKSTSLLGMKDVVQKKSTTSRNTVKELDIKVLSDAYRASESQSKKGDAARIPFSVYASRSAMTSSLAMPSNQPMMPARCLQNVQHGNQKSALCRPPRIVARQEHKAGAIHVQTHLTKSACKEPREGTLLNGNVPMTEGDFMQEKHMIPMLNKRNLKDNSVLTNKACMQDQQTHASNDNQEYVSAQPMVQCSTMEEKRAIPLVHNDKKQPSHYSKENEKEGKARCGFAEENEDSVQRTLEQHLEKLYLSTPSNKHSEVKLKIGQLEPSNNVPKQEIDQPQYVDSAVDHEMVSSQLENGVLTCKMEGSCHVESAEDNKALLHHADFGQSLRCPSNFEMNQSLDSRNASNDVEYSDSQKSGSFVDCMHTAGEPLAPLRSNMGFDKDPKQLHLVKDSQRNRGLKRKSSELNFKVNCSSRDHIHENDKVTTTGAALTSFICQQAKQSSLTSIKADPLCNSMDSCKEQHKKIKTTPFKPFRLRTEERGALRDNGLGRKEQVVLNPQELVHRALRMPSFGHPFRPQRSTKKLTVPKEPSFHSSRMRKTCTGPLFNIAA